MIAAILIGLLAGFAGHTLDVWGECKRAEKRYTAERREHERMAVEDRRALVEALDD